MLLSLPIKSSVAAFTLENLVSKAERSNAKKAGDTVGTLHFFHFVPLENNHLGFFTVYDGLFEKYIQDFTEQAGPIFDLLFKFASDHPPTPVAKNAEAFLKWAVAHNPPPIGLYSAYPGLGVQDIKALLADAREGAA